MSYQFNSSSQNTNTNDETEEMEVEQGYEADHAPTPAKTRRDDARDEGVMAPPGPASSKARCGTRSRSGSASSVASCASGASTARGAERKSRKDATREHNPSAAATPREQREQSPIYIETDDSEQSCSPERRDTPLKRKVAEVDDGAEPSLETRRKQGRPQTTGMYIGRADAIEQVNQKKREEAELDKERILRSLTTDQVLALAEKKEKKTLEETVEELGNSPTADLAQLARRSMAEILKVAKGSSNLKGGYVQILRKAAMATAASAEVLRTRADCGESESDAFRQVKALRRELEDIKREARAAREEAEKAKKEAEILREELAEAKTQAKGRSGR